MAFPSRHSGGALKPARSSRTSDLLHIIAITGRDIPPSTTVAVAGGDTICCAPYATFGTEELSRNAVAALEDRTACLLEHHGMIGLGATLDKAMWLAVEVETLARQYHGLSANHRSCRRTRWRKECARAWWLLATRVEVRGVRVRLLSSRRMC